MDQLSNGYFGYSPSDSWTPSVNLYETEGAYLICVDLAGVDKSKIDIQLHGQQISIRGARQTPVLPQPTDAPDRAGEPGKVRVHLMEIDHGSFSRQVEVPANVQRSSINAVYRDGLLWVELPKMNQEQK